MPFANSPKHSRTMQIRKIHVKQPSLCTQLISQPDSNVVVLHTSSDEQLTKQLIFTRDFRLAAVLLPSHSTPNQQQVKILFWRLWRHEVRQLNNTRTTSYLRLNLHQLFQPQSSHEPLLEIDPVHTCNLITNVANNHVPTRCYFLNPAMYNLMSSKPDDGERQNIFNEQLFL